jgi:hypothetical protein
MMKQLAFVLALFLSCTSLSFAAKSSAPDGSDDVIEAFGGTRNGGDC